MTTGGVVIIGGGQAGLQVALSLRQEGFDGPVRIVAEEPVPPYQRPPLSKGYLSDGNADGLTLRKPEVLEDQRIGLLLGLRAERIDRSAQTVALSDGRSLPYETLVLATGARPRALALPGHSLQNVLQLRNLAQADRLREALASSKSVAIIGGGFIGLEVAAFARSLGKEVTVVEAGNRILERSVSVEVSAHLLKMLRNDGITIRYRVGAVRIPGDGAGKATGLLLADDSLVVADLVLLAAGAVPNDELARAAGLHTANGVRVDRRLCTSDPHVFAVGDCAEFPAQMGWLRLESVQNAIEQGKSAARNIAGHEEPYAIVPWFWSDQGSYKLQIAGLTAGADKVVSRLSDDGRRMTAVCFKNGAFVGVETVNVPADHIAGRTLLGKGKTLTHKDFEDANFDMKALARALA